MIDPMLARTVVGGRRTTAIEVVAAVVALSAALLAALLAVPVGRAGASSPPVPAGSIHSSLARPLVYPGSGIDAFGDAGTILAEDAATIDTVGSSASEDATAFAAGALLSSPVVAMVPTAGDRGYWLAGADGAVYAFGDAALYGSLGNVSLQAPIVGMAATPDGDGYWLVAMDGGVFAFGDATFYGSMGGQPMDEPIVGMAATPTVPGTGWWRPTAGCSPSATPSSTDRWVGSRWWPRSPAWPPYRAAGDTGWWPETAGSSPSVTPSSTVPWPAAH